jgi:hypothetical protein
MRRIERLVLACGAAVLAAGALAAAGRTALPPRYSPGSLDGPLVQLDNPVDGRTWAVWAFRNGAEYDLALSFVDSNGGWHTPSLVGQGDRRNQTQPALATDGSGTVYLAFIDGPERRLLLSALVAGETEWSSLVTLSASDERAAKPVLKVVGGRLVVAYLVAGTLQVLDLPLAGSLPEAGRLPEGVSEGPDPFDREPPPDGDPPAPTPSNDGPTKTPTPRG